jgi:hypothetical protein
MKKLVTFIFALSAFTYAQYSTPNTGVVWNQDSLVAYSTGVVQGVFPNYTISGLITVSANDRVELDPSTNYTFTASSAGFEVNGVFRAVGTQNLQILFTATSQDSLGAYQGFRFNDTSIDSLCLIRFAIIEYAYYGFRCVDANPTLENSYLFKCRRGVQLSGSSPVIKNNVIHRSYEYGMTMTLGSSPLIEWNELFDNNTKNTSAMNQISVGTQGANSPTIRYNKIHGSIYHRTGGISISTLLSGSSSSSEIAYNEVYNNSFGLTFTGGSITCYVHDNKFYNNNINPDANVSGSGINVNGNTTNTPVIARNEIYGNWWGITVQNGTSIQAGPQPNIGNIENTDTTDDGQNIIYNNVQAGNIFDLFNNCTNDIYAQNNDWRVYDSTSIEGHVVHKVDDPARGYVFFMPFSDSIYIPVELTGFNCNAEGNNILIEWSTATETNNRGFEIERSIVTSSEFEIWNKIVFVQGSGTTTEANNYSYTDKNLITGKYQYRLKQIDYDGTFNYSNTVEVDIVIPDEFILYQNYPNPFNPVTLIKYVIPGNVETLHATSLRIVDILGKNVATIVNELQEPGIYEVRWDASSYPSGIYFYQLQVGSFVDTKRMLLLK